MAEKKLYQCVNTETCTLGSRAQRGVFSGGPTKEQITLITGDPEPEHYGEGVCPNCGFPAEEYDPVAERNASIKDQIAQLREQLSTGKKGDDA